MTETQNPSTQEVTADQPPTSLVARIEELEDMVYDLQQQVEDLERDSRETEMHNRLVASQSPLDFASGSLDCEVTAHGCFG
jgi:uncharacterized protein YlxW (UPF0749 family)